MSALAAVNRLLDLGMIRGRVLVLGPDAAEAAGELRQNGVDATDAPGRANSFDAVVDGGEFAAAARAARPAAVERAAARLRPLGTLFVAGRSAAGHPNSRGRISPAAVREAVDATHHRQHPAVNFGGSRNKGVIVPVQRVTAAAAGRGAVETLAFSAADATRSAVVQKQFVLPPEPIVAVQKCDSWCWAAALQMLCKSQGFDVPQETFVTRVFGVGRNGRPPCVMSGPMENMKAALDGTVGEVDGRPVRLASTVHPGVPQGELVRAQVRSLQGGRPFVLGFDAHAYVCHGVTWRERADGTGPIQITRLELIDPFPTRRRLTFLLFPAPLLTLMKIHGLLLLDVTRG